MRGHEGMLFIEGGQLLLLVNHDTSHRLVIKPEQKLEIHFGACWVEGRFEADLDDDYQPMEPFNLVCEGGSFCGLRSGMRARLVEQRGAM